MNAVPAPSSAAYRHEALLYSGMDGFLERTLQFIRDGVGANEAVLVATSSQKIDLLRSRLGSDGSAVAFADMAQVGANPACIIPYWRDFIDQEGVDGRRLRGIGEPIWRSRGSSELVECQHHESLLNVAISTVTPMWLLCPYDVANLEPAVITEAFRSHPFVTDGATPRESGVFRGVGACAAPFDAALPAPVAGCYEFDFGPGDLGDIRRLVAAAAYGAGMASSRVEDMVCAAHEVAANTVRHGGGRGVLRLWRSDNALLCEVSDQGRITDPLVDRRRPQAEAAGERGLWLANQMCDLVQIRSLPSGTVVRLHKYLRS